MTLTRSFDRWRKYRLACDELAAMDDESLRDLGIARSDIPHVARTALQYFARPARLRIV